MTGLPILGEDVGALLRAMALAGGFDEASVSRTKESIAQICSLLAAELLRQKMVASDDWFLAVLGEELRAGIEDPFLRSLPAQAEL